MKDFLAPGGVFFQVLTNGFAEFPLAQFAGGFGDKPYGGLIQAADGRFYGTTAGGGCASGLGAVFSVTIGGVLAKIVDFNGTNGSFPFAPLLLGIDGNIYGSTADGGIYGEGTLFSVATNGTFSTLVSFAGTNGSQVQGRAVADCRR